MVIFRNRSFVGFSVGLALALGLLWTSTVWQAEALPSADESTVVNITPKRILDSRDPLNVGLAGPFQSQVSLKMQVTGAIKTTTSGAGTEIVVPAGATGVLLNVTVFAPTADGFVSIRPGDATGAPTTSSLNFTAGQTVPNAVQVALPTTGPSTGQIDITYDALGQNGPTADLLIDVVAYTKASGVQDLVTQLATKANAADVYTKAQADANYLHRGEIVLRHGPSIAEKFSLLAPTLLNSLGGGVTASADGAVVFPITGPAKIGAVEYGLKSLEYCIGAPSGGATITAVSVVATFPTPVVTDATVRSAAGCYTVVVNQKADRSYELVFGLAGGAGAAITWSSLQTTWAPSDTIPRSQPRSDVVTIDEVLGIDG